MSQASIPELMDEIGGAARRAGAALAQAPSALRDAALRSVATTLREKQSDILSANDIDMAAAQKRGLSDARLDRLLLDARRIEDIAASVESICDLPDPLGVVVAEWQRPNGLAIQRISVPLGVIAIIYESRPNVTADAAALCVKSGNAVILRGGSESFHSNTAIHACLVAGLDQAGIDTATVQLVPTTDRAAVGYLLSSMRGFIDVVVPRGGKGLVQRVQQDARIPVIGHLEGICHVYVHRGAAPEMATSIAVNAKMRRTGICGAAETILVDRDAVDTLLQPIVDGLVSAGCSVRGDETVVALSPGAVAAEERDWSTEYLDAIVSIRIVDGLADAIQHIRRYGSGHTDAIVTDDAEAAERFLNDVDSAIVLHNASTQFADGGEFGMGAEIGIATDRIHARGPVGAEQLTSYKYVVRGTGQTRS